MEVNMSHEWWYIERDLSTNEIDIFEGVDELERRSAIVNEREGGGDVSVQFYGYFMSEASARGYAIQQLPKQSKAGE